MKCCDNNSPTILWEMAQSPHCGPAAVEQSMFRAHYGQPIAPPSSSYFKTL